IIDATEAVNTTLDLSRILSLIGKNLLKALHNKFSDSFSLKVCALESGNPGYDYPEEVKYTLNTNDPARYLALAYAINRDKQIELVLIQHEFGFFQQAGEDAFLQFLYGLTKPVVLVFHTVLPQPDECLRIKVSNIATACSSIVVMTKSAAQLLVLDYQVPQEKIEVIAHGIHLVPHLNKGDLKEKYGLSGKKVLSTFGLLGPGKDIGTTLSALPAIIAINPDVVFLVIGKTHPGVVLSDGEAYRKTLEAQVEALKLQDHVKFINRYLPLQDLLEYLQLTDIYLFTSKDPNQAVSGTFSYAMSCGCPIISTPIPHAREVLREDTGILIDFQNSTQLAAGVNRLMSDEALRTTFSECTLQRIVPDAWENSAIAHARVLQKIARKSINSAGSTRTEIISLKYRLPEINLNHLNKMTTDFGMIQFSNINQPDPESGYTLDDNARALIARCMHFELTGDETDLPYLHIYLEFIKHCLQPEGYFLNYVDGEKKFTEQNYATNLADSNGRAIWALGYLISRRALLPAALPETAESILCKALPRTEMMHSTRAMAFAIKGLYFYSQDKKTPENARLIKMLANRLVRMYFHESEQQWQWYESYLTYANSILPEALLYAWMETGNSEYKEIAKTSFDFLLALTFNESGIKVISNKSWLQKGQEMAPHGEQPIDIAYTILALNQFYEVFKEPDYLQKMSTAFNWFLGSNHLHQIIYNPCTGGCYDGLEETQVNLNQGAESTLSYLMARLTLERSLSAYAA
ncbi:MAG: glycosyltransferase, partial [Saprospiraceae bacterium]|nr:glycosyltransferase [Saprospiraceae bacterium]